jgi:Short C-terminal domain
MAATPPHAKMAAPRDGRHRLLVPALVLVGAVCILVSTVSVWVRDAALDTDTWVSQSSQLLESDNVRQALSVYLVDQAYSATDAEARLEAALPPQLKPLAAPAAAELQGLAYDTASAALERPAVQDLWLAENRLAHQQLVALLEGDTTRVKLTNDAVVLDVDALVANVAARVGAGAEATQAVQERVEPIVIMQADQLDALQKAVRWIKALSFWPLLIGLGLWAGAVYLAAGRRRETIRALSISLVVLGLLLLVAVRLGGDALVDALVKTDAVKPAAHDVWTIFTGLLADSAVAGIAVGLIALVSIWVAGPSARATSLRRWLAPTFRDRVELVYAVLAGVVLVLLLWGPVGMPRRLVTLVIVIALAFIGFEVLRRQTLREFPEAAHGDLSFRAAVGGAPASNPPPPPETVSTDAVDRLERLASLHDRGALTDEEYQAEKALLLR